MAVTQRLEIEPFGPALGARVTGIDLHHPIDADRAQELRKAFVDHAVLCLPGQKITPQDQVRFAALFGRVDDGQRRAADPNSKQSQRGVMLVSNIRKDGVPIGVLPDGEMQFHSDGAHRARPYRATTLYAIKIPDTGGETRFASMAAAYEALPLEMQTRLAGLKARHVFNYNKTTREEIPDDAPALAVHPLVRVHPDSGRKSLYLSRLMTREIVGLGKADSAELLEFLIGHCERPEFIHAHRWTPGDMVIWDNRCVNHARTDFPPGQDRLLRRYTVSEPD